MLEKSEFFSHKRLEIFSQLGMRKTVCSCLDRRAHLWEDHISFWSVFADSGKRGEKEGGRMDGWGWGSLQAQTVTGPTDFLPLLSSGSYVSSLGHFWAALQAAAVGSQVDVRRRCQLQNQDLATFIRHSEDLKKDQGDSLYTRRHTLSYADHPSTP